MKDLDATGREAFINSIQDRIGKPGELATDVPSLESAMRARDDIDSIAAQGEQLPTADEYMRTLGGVYTSSPQFRSPEEARKVAPEAATADIELPSTPKVEPLPEPQALTTALPTIDAD